MRTKGTTAKKPVCVRLTGAQIEAIASLQDYLEGEDGWRSSRSQIVMRMVDYGIDHFRKIHPKMTTG